MIQFNLLPDVKREFVKAKRTRRTTVVISTLVAAAALAIMVLLFITVQIFQTKYSNHLSNDIKTQSAKLENTPDLNKILTIQNQLNSLPALDDQKPALSRLFGYLKQVTPAKISIANAKVDFDANTITITGAADTIGTVNTFADTLKFTTYANQDNSKAGSPFSSVVLSSFGRDDKGASFTLTMSFDPAIFDNTQTVSLTVPQGKITTRSETEKPDALFQPLSNSGAKQ